MAETTWKDTIKEICSGKNGACEYTLLQYVKGGWDEWCIAVNYDREKKVWDSGTYLYDLASALRYMAYKIDNEHRQKLYEYDICNWDHGCIVALNEDEAMELLRSEYEDHYYNYHEDDFPSYDAWAASEITLKERGNVGTRSDLYIFDD